MKIMNKLSLLLLLASSVLLGWLLFNPNISSGHIETIGTKYHHISGMALESCPNVAAAFDNLFERGQESGASFSAFWRGKKIFDLWGGNRTDNGSPFRKDTLVNSFSVSKGLHSLVLAMLQSRTGFEYTDRVSSHWPEFARNGKENMTIEILASHRGGLLALNNYIHNNATFNSTYLDSILAETYPAWIPNGALAGYHPVSIGWFIDALVRRIDPAQRNITRFLSEEFKNFSGIEDLELHFHPKYDKNYRLAYATSARFQNDFNAYTSYLCESHSYLPSTYTYYKDLFCKAWTNPIQINADVFGLNKQENRHVFVPSEFLWTTARTMAAIYGIVASDDKRNLILSDKALEEATVEVYRGFDLMTFVKEASYTRAGFEKPTPTNPFAPNNNSFGRAGLGGQLAFADLDNQLGFAFLTRDMKRYNPNGYLLAKEVYDCIKKLK